MKITMIIMLSLILSACKTAKVNQLDGTAKEIINYETVNMNGDDAVPTFIVPPTYPTSPFSRNIEGFVSFSIDVLTDSSPDNITVLESSPKGLFDKSAFKAIKRWKFKPKMSGNEPVVQKNLFYKIEFVIDK